ncbi:MAG TPA: DinB family protein [Fimbriimonas sp.]|nr:DinB family protein [Fimbriimonas sp.]
MANLDLLLKALDTCIWEMGEGFKGLSDSDVWKRPAPKLLGIGELAAHVAYWEAISFLGEGFESPLTSTAARYYTSNIQEAYELPMGAEAVYEEVKRVHEACTESFQANPHDSEEPNPHREGWTWGFALEYQVFHIAYHTGQIYSARHFMGHETVDN